MAGHMSQRMILSLLFRSQLQLSTIILKRQSPQGCVSLIRFASQSKSLYKDLDVSDHTCNVSNYNDYQLNYKPILQTIMQTLREILDLTNSEINKMLMANPQLKKRSRANILNNYYNLLEAGIQKSTITKNVWLLAHESTKLKEKLDCISKLKMNNDELIPWLCLTQEELAHYVYYIQTDLDSYMHNKIEHLARKLECSIKELCELTVRYSFLLKIPVSYIDKKLDILHEYNVSNKHILRDLWVFRYTENHIRQRCELYKDTQNMEIKTWAIRCPLKVISRAIQKNYAKHGLMRHHKTISEYLRNKLNVDEETLNRVIRKSPHILRINLVKLDTLITLLHQNGITSNEILQNERILFFNISTIENRIKIINEVGLRLRLPLLGYAEKPFDRFVHNYRLERNVLRNHESVKCYLISKLNTNEAALDNMLKKWPNILQVKVLKMEELINVLQQSGIATNDILSYGRIFYCKVDTLLQRIEILQEAGLPLKLSVLAYSQKIFDNYVKLQKLKLQKT